MKTRDTAERSQNEMHTAVPPAGRSALLFLIGNRFIDDYGTNSDWDTAVDFRAYVAECLHWDSFPESRTGILAIRVKLPADSQDWETYGYNIKSEFIAAVKQAVEHPGGWQPKDQNWPFVMRVAYVATELPDLDADDIVLTLENLLPPEPPALDDVRVQFDSIVERIERFTEPLRREFQQLLDRLAHASLGSREANRDLVQQVNRTRRALGMAFRLCDDPDGHRVNLRFASPARSKVGSFQAKSTSPPQGVLYSGASFPALRAFRAG